MQGERGGHESFVRELHLALDPFGVAGVRVFETDEGNGIAEPEAELAVFELEEAFGFAEDGGDVFAGWGDECPCFGFVS